MVDVDPFEFASWRLQIGDLSSEDLPGLATDALVRGLDSPSLRELAAQNPRDVRDSRDLFIRALEELDMSIPEPESAMLSLVRSKASAIVAGDISPLSGARSLANAWDEVEDEGDLRIFVGLSSEADDRPEDVASLEKAIVAAASDLIRRPELRRWITLTAATERSPLTRHRGKSHTTVDVEPESLPLSAGLIEKLENWNALFIRTFEGWPRNGGFASEPQAESFVRQGKLLSTELQSELGMGYYVLYMPEPIRPPGVRLAGFGARLRRKIRKITSKD